MNGFNHREKYLQGPIECITNTSQLIGMKGRVGKDNLTNEDDYRNMEKIGYALVGGWDHIGDDVIPTYSIGFCQETRTPVTFFPFSPHYGRSPPPISHHISPSHTA